MSLPLDYIVGKVAFYVVKFLKVPFFYRDGYDVCSGYAFVEDSYVYAVFVEGVGVFSGVFVLFHSLSFNYSTQLLLSQLLDFEFNIIFKHRFVGG